jgi:transcriptional regulator with XRE-family HTH domain
MSPFSRLLAETRRRHGLRQIDLAELLGYEQTYLSALEVGAKGPPAAEFVQRLQAALNLDEKNTDCLLEALELSQRRMTLEVDAPEDIYVVFNEMRLQLNNLHPSQVGLIRATLALKSDLRERPHSEIPRLKRRVLEPGESASPSARNKKAALPTTN